MEKLKDLDSLLALLDLTDDISVLIDFFQQINCFLCIFKNGVDYFKK